MEPPLADEAEDPLLDSSRRDERDVNISPVHERALDGLPTARHTNDFVLDDCIARFFAYLSGYAVLDLHRITIFETLSKSIW